MENWEIKKDSNDFAKQKGTETRKNKTIQGRKKTNSRPSQKLKGRGNKINFPWGEIIDFGGGEFYGFAMISNKRKKIQEELRREVESKEYVIDTYGEETEEYRGAEMDLEGRENELNRQIDLSCGFWGTKKET